MIIIIYLMLGFLFGAIDEYSTKLWVAVIMLLSTSMILAFIISPSSFPEPFNFWDYLTCFFFVFVGQCIGSSSMRHARKRVAK